MTMRLSIILFVLGLLVVATFPVRAQSGSIFGATTLVTANDQPLPVSKTSLTYQDVPRKKPFGVQDIVFVEVDFNFRYNNTNDMQKQKKLTATGGLTSFIKFPSLFKLPEPVDTPMPEIGGKTDVKTQNKGNLKRSEQLKTKVACTVVSKYPNGNLQIQGTQQLALGEESKVVTIRGQIRPEDIRPDQSIPGDRVAGLVYEEVPEGNSYDGIRRPWGVKWLERWSPF
ncbi:MAG: flagellar basal body L-ring protein FlgH [Thermoguttaceae bacterium]